MSTVNRASGTGSADGGSRSAAAAASGSPPAAPTRTAGRDVGPDAVGTGGRGGQRSPVVALVVVLAAVFVQLVDVSIVNVAVPSIQQDLHASYSAVQLVLAGYQLGFACTLITGARLGDIYGRKRLFMLGMTSFTVASALCGAAPTAAVLVIARVVQGVASGLMFPQVLSVIQVAFPPKDRGRAFGLYGATIGLATILGPLLGGALIAWNVAHLTWRTIFYVNVPIGVVAVVAAVRVLAESRADRAPRLDLLGVLLSAAGLFLLIYPLTTGREHHWAWWVYLLLAASVPVLGAFVVLERRRTAADSAPLVDTRLFGDRAFRTGALLSMVFFAGIPAFFFTFSLYLQVGEGFTALGAGLTTFPFAVGSAVASSRSDAVSRRLGVTTLTLGCALLLVAQAALIVVVRVSGVHPHSAAFWPVFVLAGLGLGLFIAPVTNLILSGVDRRLAGPASGVLSTVQQVGGAIGVAVLGVIFFGLLGSNAGHAVDPTLAAARAGVATSGLPAAAQPAALAQYRRCFVRRAHATDPSAAVPGCPTATGTPVGQVLSRAARSATRRDFTLSLSEALLFEVAVFGVALALVTRLPRAAADRVPDGVAAA